MREPLDLEVAPCDYTVPPATVPGADWVFAGKRFSLAAADPFFYREP